MQKTGDIINCALHESWEAYRPPPHPPCSLVLDRRPFAQESLWAELHGGQAIGGGCDVEVRHFGT